MLKRLLPAIGLLLVATVAHADNYKNYSFNSGNWAGGAYGESNQFTHCAMSGSYRSGIMMFFGVWSNGNWAIGWASEDWDLTGRQNIPITYWIDGYGRHQAEAQVRSKTFAVAMLPASTRVFDQFRRGYVLTVEAEGRQYKFNLEGIYVALTRLVQCVSDNRPVAHSRNPASPRQRSSAPSEPTQTDEWPKASADQKIEAIKVIANILAQGEMAGSRILSESEIRTLSPVADNADVVWRTGSTISMLRVIPKTAARSVDDVSALLIASDSKSCKGEFASGFRADEHSADVKRAFAVCRTALASVAAHYTVMPMADGVIYLFASLNLGAGLADTRGAGDSEKASEADVVLRNAVHSAIKR